MKDANPGDQILITTLANEYEGILLPSPQLHESNDLILKLKSGYNIGISRDKIKEIKVIKKYTQKKKKETEIPHKKGLPTIAILSTGGTISSKIDYRTGGVYADYTARDFIEMIPELKDIANLKAKKVMSLMSEDMLPRDWKDMADMIKRESKDVDGIVLTHGTDTMHFTAAALSFMIDTPIPIIITGSQRSIDRGSSDAFMNLLCSVKAAAQSDIAEVMTCMHGTSSDDYCILIRGTKVRKMHTSKRDAFRPINDIALAKVPLVGDISYLRSDYNKRGSCDLAIQSNVSEECALIHVYPGIDPEIIDFYIKKKVKGVVIAGTALGHVNTCTEKSMLPYLKKCIEHNIPVFITSQTLYGAVNAHVYSNLRKISIEGQAVYLNDLIPETAYVKLCWVIGQTQDPKKIKEMMLTNYKNEFNFQLGNEMFLN